MDKVELCNNGRCSRVRLGEKRHLEHTLTNKISKQKLDYGYLLLGIVGAVFVSFFVFAPSTIIPDDNRWQVVVGSMAVVTAFAVGYTNISYQKKMLRTTALFKIFELLSSPNVRKSRTEMYDEYWRLVDAKKDVNFDSSSDEIKQKVDQLLSSFDQVSALVLHGSIDKEIFFDLYGEMIVRDGNALSKTIEKRQRDNERTLYHYTTLMKEFDKRILDKKRVQPYRRTKTD